MNIPDDKYARIQAGVLLTGGKEHALQYAESRGFDVNRNLKLEDVVEAIVIQDWELENGAEFRPETPGFLTEENE